MQLPPLSLTDISLVLAVLAIIFLILVELTRSSYGRTNIHINKRKLRNVAIFTGALFLVTIIIRIIGMMA